MSAYQPTDDGPGIDIPQFLRRQANEPPHRLDPEDRATTLINPQAVKGADTPMRATRVAPSEPSAASGQPTAVSREDLEIALASEVRLRAAWLRVIQAENACVVTGRPCDAKRCGCAAEQEMLLREAEETNGG